MQTGTCSIRSSCDHRSYKLQKDISRSIENKANKPEMVNVPVRVSIVLYITVVH